MQTWPPLQSFEAKAGTPAGQGFEVGPSGAVLWEAQPGPYGEWGRREHTVYVDHAGQRLGQQRRLARDLQVHAGRQDTCSRSGTHGKTNGSNDRELLGRPAGLVVDPEANELFVADGYTNKRVIVFDARDR